MASLSGVYSGIEVANVQRLLELNQPIDEISSLMHQIEGEVAGIANVLAKFSATNRDQQYYNVVASTKTMCDELNQGAEELYRCQMAISNYIEKLGRYEEVPVDVSSFSLAEFPFPNIDVDPTTTIFVKQEMMYVYDEIGAFCSFIDSKIIQIQNIPDTADGWRDAQKQELQSYIDELVDTLTKGCQNLVDYQNHLGTLIQGLD